MKVWVGEHGQIIFGDVFNAIGIETEHGRFGICQRDGGLEVVRAGEIVWSSTAPVDVAPTDDRIEGRTWTPTRFEGACVLVNLHDPQPSSYHVERWGVRHLARKVAALRAQRDEAMDLLRRVLDQHGHEISSVVVYRELTAAAACRGGVCRAPSGAPDDAGDRCDRHGGDW